MSAGLGTRIRAEDCADIAAGATILGTGGGGDPHIGKLMAEQALREKGPVSAVPLDEVPEDATVLPVAMMGAPTVMVEKLPSAEQFEVAVQAMADYLGRRPTHIACAEAGGVNSLIPVVAAAQLGLPIVDADGMGRAFPELQMVLPTIYGIGATPMSLSDEKGNALVLNTATNLWAERLARVSTVEMGGSTIISNYPMTGAQVRRAYVPGTLSLCARLGGALRESRARAGSGVEPVAEILGAEILGSGRVVDVERRTTGGFARGTLTLATEDGELAVDFQNENLLARRGETVLATTPDLIIGLDSDTGEAITTEAMRFGVRLTLIVAPADERWHTDAGLELAGPRYFGYDTDVVRVGRAGRAGGAS